MRRGGKWIKKNSENGVRIHAKRKRRKATRTKEQMIQERKDKTEKAIELFNTGMTMKEIAIMLGVSRPTVGRMLMEGRTVAAVINKYVDKGKVKALYDARSRNVYWDDLDHIAKTCECTVEQVKQILMI